MNETSASNFDPLKTFEARNPSANWEVAPLEPGSQLAAWAWFKPGHLPAGIVFHIPSVTYQSHPTPTAITLRALLAAVGLQPEHIAGWQAFGTSFESQGGTNPVIDQPIPPAPAGSDPNISVIVASGAQSEVPLARPAATVTAVGGTNSAEVEKTFDRMEADWLSCVTLEKQLAILRKQLAATMSRLGSLNRDLTPDERINSDRQDQNDWQDARRWLRDSASRLSRFIKEYDVGQTSNAGKRLWYEQMYDQYVAPRRNFAELDRVQHEFENHRKTLQILSTNMNTALANAAQDGERRAQQLLSRIASKVRNNKTRNRS